MWGEGAQWGNVQPTHIPQPASRTPLAPLALCFPLNAPPLFAAPFSPLPSPRSLLPAPPRPAPMPVPFFLPAPPPWAMLPAQLRRTSMTSWCAREMRSRPLVWLYCSVMS